MRVAIVHEMLIKLGGAERVLKKLLQLFPGSPVYTLLYKEKAVHPWFPEVNVAPSHLQTAYRLCGKPRLLLPFMSRAIEAFDFSGFDLVLSSSSGFAHGIKTGPQTRHITYCHSPMRYAWDYTHALTRGQPFWKQWAAANLLHPLRQWDFTAAERPDRVLTNAQHVRRRIQKYWRREAEVLYPPVEVRRFTPRRDHEDYFLIVSALTPFKRIDLAVTAFSRLRRNLVVVGDGAQRKALEALAGPTVRFLGWRTDDETRDLLEHCRALIFPGEEDFGIVPVEAMAAGKPVLAYGKGGVTESVVPGVSGEFFEEPTPESLEAGLTRLLLYENDYDQKRIRSLAERFDEDRFEEGLRQAIATISS